MAKTNEFSIPAHYNIYTAGKNGRKLNIYFSEPEQGVNEDTGILLLIPGFGGNSQSNVYKKMRSKFADDYNLIVIQCDYFGIEYMQSSNRVKLCLEPSKFRNLVTEQEYNIIQGWEESPEKVINILSNYSCVFTAVEDLNENVTSFNDMGFMQAMDLLSALYSVKIILKDNNLPYNGNKVIAYGHSHGSYLAYLCNRLAPNDFSLIIDNSAWLKPEYLTASRYLNEAIGKSTLQTRFDYFARSFNYDKEILGLSKLYHGFKNNAEIWSFQGKTDNLVNYLEKEEFCKSIENTTFHLIDEKKVDNIKFFSTGHGLQSDFLKVFEYVIEKVDIKKINNSKLTKSDYTVLINKNIKYIVNFKCGLPILTVKDEEIVYK